MAPVDIDCLYTKAALSLPESALRDALLRSYMQFVHPELPIIEIRELLRMVNREDGDSGRVSLLLFQAVMFAGASFVDMKLLRSAGYSNRRDARNALFQKVKVFALVSNLTIVLTSFRYSTTSTTKQIVCASFNLSFS